MQRFLILLSGFVALMQCSPVALTGGETTEVSLPGYYSDHMVLQRGVALPLQGSAAPGQVVRVEFAGQVKRTKSDEAGQWTVSLDPMEALSEGTALKIGATTLQDVVVGDVWLCSGQSNMEWQVNRSLNPEDVQSSADNPLIRHMKIAHLFQIEAQEDVDAEWIPASPETVGAFTAVGYHFAMELFKELNVPIGLIGSNWGGTRIEPWIPPFAFAEFEDIAHLEEVARNPEPIDRSKRGSHQKPSLLYNAMIHPLTSFPIRGAIWYQGESNAKPNDAIHYATKKKALVHGWRKAWGLGDFPFYYVQLANFREYDPNPAGGTDWAVLMDQQRQALEIPRTGMAVIIDIGDPKDIHPKNKQDVGYRLAQWALADEYGQDVVPSGPLFRAMVIEDGTARIHFDYADSGLMAGEKEPNGAHEPVLPLETKSVEGFAIAGADQEWHWASAVIDGDTILVSSPEVPEPVAVRYAFRQNPEKANLYNRAGLPASPFRTDDWPLP